MYEIVKHYRHNKALRDSFNALAEATFGLNFESWYQNGFWGDDYDPYSIVIDGKVVANVSLNRVDMIICGQRKRIYQLGTVMTAPEYRNRGLIRSIMAQIEEDTRDADGIYLFANDSVLDFYPKFGFRKEKEYVYSKETIQTGACRMENIPMDSAAGWARLSEAMAENTFAPACYMAENPGLVFFYVSQFMQSCVYRDSETGAFVVAELEDGELVLHNVFSAAPVCLDAIIAAFGSEVKQVTLGFTPADTAGYTCREHHEEDCTFFVKGEAFQNFADAKLRIPTLSHA